MPFPEAGPDALQLGDVVAQLLLRLDLLPQVLRLQEVGHLRVVVLAGDLVQVQERLQWKKDEPQMYHEIEQNGLYYTYVVRW